MITYQETTADVSTLEPMRGVELVYFVIPEAVRWSVVHILSVLDGPIDVNALRHRVEHGFGRFERLRQKPVRQGERFFWETTPALNLDDHVRTVAPGTAETKASIETLLGSMLTAPLDPARPLWEVLYVPKYETGAAVILRIHHAYGDGRSLMAIATSIVAESAEASLLRMETAGPLVRHKAVADSITPPGKGRFGPAAEGFPARILYALRIRFRAIRKMLSSFKKDHGTGFDEMPSEQKSVTFSRALARGTIRAAGKQIQCTLNDMVLSGISGALRSHLQRRGLDPAQTRLTVSIPVDLHSSRSAADMTKNGVLTNHLGTVSLQLPVGIADGVARAREISRAMMQSVECGEPLMQYKSFSSFHKMPAWLLVKMFRGQAHKQSGIISNLPGPKQPFYVAGQRVNSWLFWVIASHLPGAHLGLSVTHYNDEIRIGLTLPQNAGYDARALLDEIVREIEGLADRILREAPAEAPAADLTTA